VASERAENAKLRAKNAELETRLEEKTLAQLEQAKCNAVAQDTLKCAFDASVLLLSEQLRAINAQAITKVQEVGQHFDEQAMLLKLELHSLKEQLSQKDKELKKLTAQLSTASVESKYGV